jgi:hypothetical protein
MQRALVAAAIAVLSANAGDAAVLVMKGSGTITSATASNYVTSFPYDQAEPQIGTAFGYSLLVDTAAKIPPGSYENPSYGFVSYLLNNASLTLTVGDRVFSYEVPVTFRMINNTPYTGQYPIVDQVNFGYDSLAEPLPNYATPFALGSARYINISFAATDYSHSALLSSGLDQLSSGWPTFSVSSLTMTVRDTTVNYVIQSANVVTTVSAESDVPEPTTWAMFMGGFGLIGGAMRRRDGRRKSLV